MIVSYPDGFFDGIRKMPGNPVIPFPAVTTGGAVALHNRRQLPFGISEGSEIKGIRTRWRNVAAGIRQPVYAYAHHAHTVVPRCDDFVVDPLAICGTRTDEDDRAGTIPHLVRNPFPDGTVAASLDGFPSRCRLQGPVAFDAADVANYGRTPVVRTVVKAVEPLYAPWACPNELLTTTAITIVAMRAP